MAIESSPVEVTEKVARVRIHFRSREPGCSRILSLQCACHIVTPRLNVLGSRSFLASCAGDNGIFHDLINGSTISRTAALDPLCKYVHCADGILERRCVSA